MSTTVPSLLLKFRARDTAFGITRETMKRMAELYELSETEVAHLALSRLARESLPTYEPDDGPLSTRDLAAVQKAAAVLLPKGKVVAKKSLF